LSKLGCGGPDDGDDDGREGAGEVEVKCGVDVGDVRAVSEGGAEEDGGTVVLPLPEQVKPSEFVVALVNGVLAMPS